MKLKYKYLFGPYAKDKNYVNQIGKIDILNNCNWAIIYPTVSYSTKLFQGEIYINRKCFYRKCVEQNYDQYEKLKKHLDEVIINIGGIILTEEEYKKYKLLE